MWELNIPSSDGTNAINGHVRGCPKFSFSDTHTFGFSGCSVTGKLSKGFSECQFRKEFIHT